MRDPLRLTLAWIAASAVAVFVALLQRPAAWVAGHYIPVGNDSFYHARRILDLAAQPGSLREFDPLVHAPEGSLLIWPWGYDFLMSLLLRAGALVTRFEPMAILDHLPVLAFPAALALILSICRQLQVGLAGTVAALLATALFPLNQGLYGLGSIDHHFAEHLLVLAMLASALAWIGNPNSWLRAATLGAVLGFAPAIHNGLFILQLPMLLAMLWLWGRSRGVPRTAWRVAAVLVCTTVLAAAPSTAFREGQFEFHALSWFHVYAAACTAVALVYLGHRPFTRNAALLLAAMCAVMVLPVASQLLLAERFLSVSIEGAEQISEVQSLWELGTNRGDFMEVARNYTFLAFLLPVTMALCAWRLWGESDARRSFLWLTSLFGLVLLAMMVRLHVFGSFALYLPWIVVLSDWTVRGLVTARTATAALALAMLAAYGPIVTKLFSLKMPGNDPYYALTHDLYPAFADECRRAPGIALASLDDGNYIRYHTDCAVIANNFLLTPLHEKKVRELRSLLELPPQELLSRAPMVRYVYVRRGTLFRIQPGGRMEFLPNGDPQRLDPPLVAALLAAPATELPPRFRLVRELAFEKPVHAPFARLFAIEPAR